MKKKVAVKWGILGTILSLVVTVCEYKSAQEEEEQRNLEIEKLKMRVKTLENVHGYEKED